MNKYKDISPWPWLLAKAIDDSIRIRRGVGGVSKAQNWPLRRGVKRVLKNGGLKIFVQGPPYLLAR